MLKLKDDQIFGYKTRAMPNQRSLNQKLFADSIYPWRYHFTCNDLLNNSEKKFLSLKSENFYDEMRKVLQPYETEMVLVSNPEYSSSWSFDGSHSDIWTQFEKGIDGKELQEFYDKFLLNDIALRGKSFIGIKII